MGKRIFCLLLLLGWLLPGGGVLAQEQAIHSVEIHVDLLENGDAQIWELWDVTVTSGTEWYLSLNGMGDMPVSDLSVADETGTPYKNIGQWDVGRSLSEKANTCGIVEKENAGYELCWGVGSYGRHEFFVSYTISGLVKHYEDAAGFNHTFLSKGLSAPVDTASVTLYCPGRILDESNAAFWAFGFEGTIERVQGNIHAQSDKRITKKEGMILLVKFDPALFPTAPQGEGTFEAIESRAMAGSDYAAEEAEHGEVPGVVWGILGGVLALGAFGVSWGILRASLPDVYYREKYGASRIDMRKQAAPTGDVPFQGDVQQTIALMDFLGDTPSQVSLLNFYLLQWMREGVITLTREERGDGQSASLFLGQLPPDADVGEAQLYGMLSTAARAQTLTQKDIKTWARKSGPQIDRWHKACLLRAMEHLRVRGVTTQEPVQRAFVSATVEVLNDQGWAYAQQVYGYKNFLLRCAQEGNLPPEAEKRDEMLAYADLFGLYEGMEPWYENDNTGRGSYYSHYYFMSRAFRSAYQSGVASRSDGGGGSSSSGGGGGASGGGGGGSR